MFGISDFFGPFSVGICPEFFLFFRSLMSSIADTLRCRPGGGSGGGGGGGRGGGGGGGAPGTAAEATGLNPTTNKTRILCQFTGNYLYTSQVLR